MAIDWSQKTVLVTGGHGFLGQVVCRELRRRGCREVVAPQRCDTDLLDSDEVSMELEHTQPQIVFHLAAEVGGIGANQAKPGRMFCANMTMGLNVIEAARIQGVEKFVQVGTACSYPENAVVPFHESCLWNGYPEPTNAPYGIAKRALGTMLEAYRDQYGFDGVHVILANLYGPGDNFDPETSHVIPALIRKFHEAKRQGQASVTCWGTGHATRDFLYVEDAAEAVILAAEQLDDSEPVNIGSGHEISIRELAYHITGLIRFDGAIEWDTSRPDGQPRRRLDTLKATERLRWVAHTRLDTGLRRTIEWWEKQHG